MAVTLSRRNGSVVLAVHDDGRGFDPAAARAADGPSLGLRLLEDLGRSATAGSRSTPPLDAARW